jgi:GNAT superfamily N-acetyltransferase
MTVTDFLAGTRRLTILSVLVSGSTRSAGWGEPLWPFRRMAQRFSGTTRSQPAHSHFVLLARLAVDVSFHGQRLGEGLLMDALERSRALSAEMGVHAVEVAAIDGQAAAFYRKYRFTQLVDNPLHLYLPITTIEKSFG